jgi:transcriptional regulator with XRE-family HTH domain
MPSRADLVYEERRRRGWSQDGLGDRIGLSKSSVGAIERGAHFHDLDKLHKIALVFADGDKQCVGIWLYQTITAMGYPLPALAEVK